MIYEWANGACSAAVVLMQVEVPMPMRGAVTQVVQVQVMRSVEVTRGLAQLQ